MLALVKEGSGASTVAERVRSKSMGVLEQESPAPGQKDEPTLKGGCSQLASWLSYRQTRIPISRAILSSLMYQHRSIAKYGYEGRTYL